MCRDGKGGRKRWLSSLLFVFSTNFAEYCILVDWLCRMIPVSRNVTTLFFYGLIQLCNYRWNYKEQKLYHFMNLIIA